MIPATPAKTGGAGTGSLSKAKTTPQVAPVRTEKNISFILSPISGYIATVVADYFPSGFITNKRVTKEVAS